MKEFYVHKGDSSITKCALKEQWYATFNDGGSFSVKIQSVNSATKHVHSFSPNLRQAPAPLAKLTIFALTATNTLYQELKCSQTISFCQFCYGVESSGRQAEGTKPKEGQTLEKTSLSLPEFPHWTCLTPSLLSLSLHQILSQALFKWPGCGFLLPSENSQTHTVCIIIFCRSSKQR